MHPARILSASLCLSLVFVTSCDGDTGTDAGFADGGSVADGGGTALTVPDHYVFDSRFEPGTTSVSHTGQTARHVLMQDLKAYVDGLTGQIDRGELDPAETVVVSNLEYFFSLPAADRAGDPLRTTTEPAADQATYGELSSSADLVSKLAGNDTVTDHRDWATEFSGWSDASLAMHGGDVSSPTGFTRAIFETLEANAIARGTGVDRPSPVAAPEALPVHVTESGVDLSQLLAKFLLSALAFHQAADDYLDDDVEGKGLLADNVERDGDEPFTALEHGWDEAFGYFGASSRYGDIGAAALAAGPVHVDHDGSGGIDLFSEYNFGASVNAAKRDAGASTPTDFMGQAWTAFRTGRAIISSAGGALDAEQMAALRAQRDLAVGAWEAAIAATVVHYLNELLVIMDDFGTPAYDHARFLDHAKAWSEMKGFALMFQFNPRSPVTSSQFAMLHSLVGDAPVLPAAGDAAVSSYRVALRDARAILGTAFGFDAANLGDDAGVGGW